METGTFMDYAISQHESMTQQHNSFHETANRTHEEFMNRVQEIVDSQQTEA